jgi:hypothetical protein
MTDPGIADGSPALEEAARELQAAQHDAQVAYDCIALGDLDRAHTHALTSRVALDRCSTGRPFSTREPSPAYPYAAFRQIARPPPSTWPRGRGHP